MTRLTYSVYVTPAKPAVSDDLPPGEAERMWSPTASTLIAAERDAVLVDPLMTGPLRGHGRALPEPPQPRRALELREGRAGLSVRAEPPPPGGLTRRSC
ncbi:hypothetical protein GCM10009610_56260 [Pseudonocardia xinjiangensis]